MGSEMCIRDSLNAVVSGSEITGSETFIHARTGTEPWVVLTPGVFQIASGDSIDLYIDPDSIYLFDSHQQLVLEPAMRATGV